MGNNWLVRKMNGFAPFCLIGSIFMLGIALALLSVRIGWAVFSSGVFLSVFFNQRLPGD
jgi:hypothetical protein